MDAIRILRNKFKFDKESPWYFYRKVLLWSFVVSACITIPFIIVEWIKTGSAIFLYYGDYNGQQIPFYEHCVAMVHDGNFGWDWVTDMGSNFVGSYSYYMLGSPFFWIMCLFPSTWIPYLMAPMYMVKYMVAAVLAYAYLQRFVKNKNYAVIGALLYSFSGFQIYNTFFNQFHDVVAFFPLLLIGIEEYVQNDRRGLFAIAVTLNAMINYFMFAGQVVFCVIYFFARICCKSFRIDLKKFAGLAFEAVIGFVMAWFIFLPAATALMGNSRIERSYLSTLSDYFEQRAAGEKDQAFKSIRSLFVWRSGSNYYWQRYGQIFESYFFPPDIPSRVNFFDGHATRWASISMYLPMFGMAGVFSLFTVKKRTWLKVLIGILILSSFVPILNSMFFLFNSSYYARWLYMMILMFSLATTVMLEDTRSNWKIPTALMTFFCTVVAVPLGLVWHENVDLSELIEKKDTLNWSEVLELGYPPYRLRFWIYVALAFLGIMLTAYLIRKYRGTKVFEKAILLGVSGMIILYACIHISNGKQYGDDSKFLVDQVIEGRIELPDPHEEFYRIDQYKSNSKSTVDNLGISWDYPTIQNFHTVVPPSIMEFYPHLGITRNVASRVLSEVYGLRAFTSVKYSVIPTNKNQVKTTVNSTDPETGKTSKVTKYTEAHNTYGFEKIDSQNGFDIYENTNYIPMGFVYTEFMTETDFEKCYKEEDRHIVLCKYLVVPDDKADYYSQFMTRVTDGAATTKAMFEKSVDDRKSMCCSDFNYTSQGFDAKITLDSPNVVYFSVPYETNGWSATVNGKETEVLKVTFGFVAVECEAGENEIVFDYSTPGFRVPCELTVGETQFSMPGGLWWSLGALVIFIGYMFFVFKYKKHKARCDFFSFDDYDDCGAGFDMPVACQTKAVEASEISESETEVTDTDEQANN
ncbi:MAG: hypothetical protein E7586_01490 [Ruminococcaceae bacterium]|nr:hypothetical protein [Oscillospiraceae bacterium]